MSVLREVILNLFGLFVGIAAALVVLPIALLLDPVTGRAGTVFAHFALFSLVGGELAQSSDVAFAELAGFVWTILVAVCAVPLAITALTGAAARVHSLARYAGATGFIAALAPWVARAALGATKAGAPARRNCVLHPYSF